MTQDAPRLPRERIEALDVLRGVAVCGLVPMNILDFAFAEDHYFSPGSLSGSDLWLWHFAIVLCSGKFMSLFSLLFGAGILLSTSRKDAAGEPVTARYLRRLGLLACFGLMHAYLVWYGDILVAYAVTGFVVFWCRKWSPRTQAICGAIMISVLPLIALMLWVVVTFVDLDWSALMESDAESAAWEQTQIDALRGGWLEQMPVRALYAFLVQLFGIPLILFWTSGGLMFFGMALTKIGFLTGEKSPSTYRRLAAICIPAGIALGTVNNALSQGGEWRFEEVLFHFPLGYIGTFLLAIGYASLVLLWCRAPGSGSLRQSFASVGRMALSNYIGQSVILGLIFYGHGLGLYDHLEFKTVLAIPPAVWALQIIISTLWMKYFRFGPLEWIWRCLTYGRRFPMRIFP